MADLKGKYKRAPFFWRQLLWKVTIIALILLILAEIGFIWLNGGSETKDAMDSGRRLLITLETGAIEGNPASTAQETAAKNEEKESKAAPEEHKSEADAPPAANDEKKPAETESKPVEPEKKETPAVEEKDKPEASAPPAPEPQPEAEIVKTIDTIKEEKEIELPPLSPSSNPPAEFSADVSEKTEYGSMPKISSSGAKPWKYYSKQVTVKDKKPMIAIIVTGLGQNRNISEQAMRLPENIALSFSPYSKDLNSWMLSARLSGHEVLLDLPMEAANYPVTDPGPLGLLVSKDQAQNETKIKKLMAQEAGYIGFVTPQDEAFLENNDIFKSLLQVLAGRGLMLVVGKQPPKNETKELIENGNTASVILDNLIDEELVPIAIQARLSLLEQNAKQRGYAVGIANAYPVTIKQINEWAAKATENGFNIVPISTIVSKRF